MDLLTQQNQVGERNTGLEIETYGIIKLQLC